MCEGCACLYITPFTLALKLVSNQLMFKLKPHHYVVYKKQFPKCIRGAISKRFESGLKC